MRYVNLGNTGPRVSRVCLGMMSFGRHKTRQWARTVVACPASTSLPRSTPRWGGSGSTMSTSTRSTAGTA